MSVWKSPILYLGILIFGIVVAALAAPFVMDWNAYKPRLETYGQNLTGRKVAIDGPIAVRLFPVPRLVAEDVRITNLDNDKTVFAAADRIIIDVTLGGLLNGNLDVQSIQVDAPVINIIRRKSGIGNWVMTPSEDLRNSLLLKNVKLENINLNRATLVFRDEAKGFEQTLQELDLNLSAPSIMGPWRAQGSGFNNGHAIALNVTASAAEKEQPFRFGARVTPIDPSLPQIAIDAAIVDDTLDGTLRIDAVPQEGAKSDRKVGLRALALQSKLKANFDKVTLVDIKITPRDPKDGSTLIEGGAEIDLTKGINVTSRLKSPRINLDQIFGSGAIETFRGGGIMALANQIFKALPKHVFADFGAEATVLTLGSDQLENVQVEMALEKDAARLKRVSANLPGRSRMLLIGVMFPAEKTAELGGKLSFESSDLRAFTTWARPSYKNTLQKYWIGSRGRIKGDADLNWQGDNLSFENLRYELDGVAGTANVGMLLGDQTNTTVALKTPTLDLDAYLRSADRKVMLPWSDLATFFVAGGEATEKSFDVVADRLILNGVVAQNAVLDFISGKAGLDIRAIKIADLAGTTFDVTGQVLKAKDSFVGQLQSDLKAQNLENLVQFLGLKENARVAAFAKSMISGAFQGRYMFSPTAEGTAVTMTLSGKSGPLSVSSNGELILAPNNNVARLAGDLKLSAEDSLSLMRLVNPNATTVGTASELMVSMAGDLAEAVQTKAQAKIYGADIQFDGTTKLIGGKLAVEGPVAFSASDGGDFLRSLGMNITDAQQIKFLGPAQWGENPGFNLTGSWGQRSVDIVWRTDENKEAQIDVALPLLDFKSMLAASLFSSGESTVDLNVENIDGELWLRPEVLQMPDGTIAKEAVFGVRQFNGKRTISFLARAEGDRTYKGEAELSLQNFVPKLTYKLEGPVNLATLSPISGLLDTSISGTAEGLDLSQILASAKAAGEYQMSLPLEVVGLNIGGFADAIGAVKSDVELKTALSILEQNGKQSFSPKPGQITVANGELKLSPLSENIAGGTTDFALEVDLNQRNLASALAVKLNQPRQLPAIEVIFSGQPGGITRSIRSSAFAADLGFDILARDMRELERIQQEQKRLADEEAQQQAMDAEKFEAFQSQKVELRLRQRELKVFAELRIKADKLRERMLAEALREPSLDPAREIERRSREQYIFKVTANGASSPAVLPENSSLTPMNFPDGIELPVEP